MKESWFVMQDSMMVKARVGVRVKLGNREGQVVKVLTEDFRDPMVAVALEARSGSGRTEEVVGRLSLFTELKSSILAK